MAGLDLSDKELERFEPEFEAILSEVEKIREIDDNTDENEQEEESPSGSGDIPKRPLSKEEALKNAPNKKDNFIIISRKKYD